MPDYYDPENNILAGGRPNPKGKDIFKLFECDVNNTAAPKKGGLAAEQHVEADGHTPYKAEWYHEDFVWHSGDAPHPTGKNDSDHTLTPRKYGNQSSSSLGSGASFGMS